MKAVTCRSVDGLDQDQTCKNFGLISDIHRLITNNNRNGSCQL